MLYSTRVLCLGGYGLLATLWLRSTACKRAPGFVKFLLCIPVLIGDVLAVFVFDKDTELVSYASVLLSNFWLGTFKVCTRTTAWQWFDSSALFRAT